jgi:hypothetical protein
VLQDGHLPFKDLKIIIWRAKRIFLYLDLRPDDIFGYFFLLFFLAFFDFFSFFFFFFAMMFTSFLFLIPFRGNSPQLAAME